MSRILALLGIEVPLNMGVEVADERAVTRYLLRGGIIVMVAYLAVNWALMVAVPPAQGGNLGALVILADQSMGVFFEWVVGLIVIGFFIFITVVEPGGRACPALFIWRRMHGPE